MCGNPGFWGNITWATAGREVACRMTMGFCSSLMTLSHWLLNCSTLCNREHLAVTLTASSVGRKTSTTCVCVLTNLKQSQLFWLKLREPPRWVGTCWRSTCLWRDSRECNTSTWKREGMLQLLWLKTMCCYLGKLWTQEKQCITYAAIIQFIYGGNNTILHSNLKR